MLSLNIEAEEKEDVSEYNPSYSHSEHDDDRVISSTTVLIDADNRPLSLISPLVEPLRSLSSPRIRYHQSSISHPSAVEDVAAELSSLSLGRESKGSSMSILLELNSAKVNVMNHCIDEITTLQKKIKKGVASTSGTSSTTIIAKRSAECQTDINIAEYVEETTRDYIMRLQAKAKSVAHDYEKYIEQLNTTHRNEMTKKESVHSSHISFLKSQYEEMLYQERETVQTRLRNERLYYEYQISKRVHDFKTLLFERVRDHLHRQIQLYIDKICTYQDDLYSVRAYTATSSGELGGDFNKVREQSQKLRRIIEELEESRNNLIHGFKDFVLEGDEVFIASEDKSVEVNERDLERSTRTYSVPLSDIETQTTLIECEDACIQAYIELPLPIAIEDQNKRPVSRAQVQRTYTRSRSKKSGKGKRGMSNSLDSDSSDESDRRDSFYRKLRSKPLSPKTETKDQEVQTIEDVKPTSPRKIELNKRSSISQEGAKPEVSIPRASLKLPNSSHIRLYNQKLKTPRIDQEIFTSPIYKMEDGNDITLLSRKYSTTSIKPGEYLMGTRVNKFERSRAIDAIAQLNRPSLEPYETPRFKTLESLSESYNNSQQRISLNQIRDTGGINIRCQDQQQLSVSNDQKKEVLEDLYAQNNLEHDVTGFESEDDMFTRRSLVGKKEMPASSKEESINSEDGMIHTRLSPTELKSQPKNDDDYLTTYISRVEEIFEKREQMLKNEIQTLSKRIEELQNENIDLHKGHTDIRTKQATAILKLTRENLSLTKRLQKLSQQHLDLTQKQTGISGDETDLRYKSEYLSVSARSDKIGVPEKLRDYHPLVSPRVMTPQTTSMIKTMNAFIAPPMEDKNRIYSRKLSLKTVPVSSNSIHLPLIKP